MTEFKEWQKEEQFSKNVSFSFARSKSQTNGSLIKYFDCNRSGKHLRQQKLRNREKQLKSQGSCRSGFHCPARIRFELTKDKKVIVDYVFTHIGHSCEAEHVRIDDEHREIIRADLERGVNPTTIWRNIRKDYTPTKTIRPHNLLTKQDVRNILKKFDLDKPGQMHSSDPLSVDLFVDESRMSNNVIVTSYKRQGEVNIEFPGLGKDEFLF